MNSSTSLDIPRRMSPGFFPTRDEKSILPDRTLKSVKESENPQVRSWFLNCIKNYRLGLRKAISVILDDQKSIPICTFLVRFVLDLFEWNSNGFYFFMRDMDEEVEYHDVHLVHTYIIGRDNKKPGWHFKSPGESSFLDTQPQQPHILLKE